MKSVPSLIWVCTSYNDLEVRYWQILTDKILTKKYDFEAGEVRSFFGTEIFIFGFIIWKIFQFSMMNMRNDEDENFPRNLEKG